VIKLRPGWSPDLPVKPRSALCPNVPGLLVFSDALHGTFTLPALSWRAISEARFRYPAWLPRTHQGRSLRTDLRLGASCARADALTSLRDGIRKAIRPVVGQKASVVRVRTHTAGASSFKRPALKSEPSTQDTPTTPKEPLGRRKPCYAGEEAVDARPANPETFRNGVGAHAFGE
jgi:hypothetical protein